MIQEDPNIVLTGKMEYKDGKFGRKLNIVVLHMKKEITWTPNGKSINFLIKKHGDQSEKWDGVKLKMVSVKQGTPQGIRDVLYPEGAI